MAENNMNQNKYVSPSKLSLFLDNLRNIFSPLTHTHELAEISDYTVDSELSSTSENPVRNSVVNAKFDEVDDTLETLVSRIFVGTYEEYETANANGEIALNAIVIITDDENNSSSGGGSSGDSSSSTSTTSVLGEAILGQMILG